MIWTCLHPNAMDWLGYLPGFLSEADARPAQEQLHTAYAHGGGWRPMDGWEYNPFTSEIKYPGDPALAPVAFTQLRDEQVLVYPHAWVVVVQSSGAFAVARMD